MICFKAPLILPLFDANYFRDTMVFHWIIFALYREYNLNRFFIFKLSNFVLYLLFLNSFFFFKKIRLVFFFVTVTYGFTYLLIILCGIKVSNVLIKFKCKIYVYLVRYMLLTFVCNSVCMFFFMFVF